MESYTTYNDELLHYGVKGMRWGVRRAEKFRTKEAAARSQGKEGRADRMARKAKEQENVNAFKNYRKKSGSERRAAASKMTDREKDDLRDGANTLVKRSTYVGLGTFGVYGIIPAAVVSVAKSGRALSDLDATSVDTGRSAVEKHKSQPVAMLTSEQAKKLGYGDNTRLSAEEESQFWKDYAAQIERERSN